MNRRHLGPLLGLWVLLAVISACSGHGSPGPSVESPGSKHGDSTGGETSATGTPPASGGSGDSGAPPCQHWECFRAVECVASCGGPVLKSGCCPCDAGTFDRIQCGAAGGAVSH
jgi:hypothetical protein